MGRTRKEVIVVIVLDESIGDVALIKNANVQQSTRTHSTV